MVVRRLTDGTHGRRCRSHRNGCQRSRCGGSRRLHCCACQQRLSVDKALKSSQEDARRPTPGPQAASSRRHLVVCVTNHSRRQTHGLHTGPSTGHRGRAKCIPGCPPDDLEDLFEQRREELEQSKVRRRINRIDLAARQIREAAQQSTGEDSDSTTVATAILRAQAAKKSLRTDET